MKLKSYSVSAPSALSKQWCILGTDESRNACAPLVYLQRPKWIKDDLVWQNIVVSVQLSLPKGFEVK